MRAYGLIVSGLAVLVAGCGAGHTTSPPAGTATPTGPPSAASMPTGYAPEHGDGNATVSSPAHLVDVRVDRQQGFDRVIFRFEGAQPSYAVRYLKGDKRPHAPGSGKPVEIHGGRVVRATFSHARPGGPDVRTPRLPAVRQVKNLGGHEGTVTVAIGVDVGRAFVPAVGFRVRASGTTVTVDIAHPKP